MNAHQHGDTMSDAIALSSPSGRMSKRARKAAQDRITMALFGPGSGFIGWKHVPTDEERRQDRIVQLRSYIQTLRTCCANKLRTGRANKTTKALDAAIAELAALKAEEGVATE